jgi:hypothetical protein
MHAKQSRHRRKRKAYRPPQLALSAPLALDHDNQVLTFFNWCRLNGISESTGRRILASGNGPQITMLSARRIGIRVAANREWQAAHARGAQT